MVCVRQLGYRSEPLFDLLLVHLDASSRKKLDMNLLFLCIITAKVLRFCQSVVCKSSSLYWLEKDFIHGI